MFSILITIILFPRVFEYLNSFLSQNIAHFPPHDTSLLETRPKPPSCSISRHDLEITTDNEFQLNHFADESSLYYAIRDQAKVTKHLQYTIRNIEKMDRHLGSRCLK